MNEHVEQSHKIRGNEATQILGVSTFFLTPISLYIINRFPRKKLMITQQIGMIIFLLGIGASAFLENSIFALIFIVSHFCFILICTVFWIYMPEVLNDNQLGVSAATFYFNGVILSFITEYLIKFFGVDGVFGIFAVVQIIGLLFISNCIKETTGLTDHEKKELYYPDKFKTSNFMIQKNTWNNMILSNY